LQLQARQCLPSPPAQEALPALLKAECFSVFYLQTISRWPYIPCHIYIYIYIYLHVSDNVYTSISYVHLPRGASKRHGTDLAFWSVCI
jgi:hypothetical protein